MRSAVIRNAASRILLVFLVLYLVANEGAVRVLAEEAPYINTWLVCGPFKDDAGYESTFVRRFINESSIEPINGDEWIKLDDRLFSRNYDDYIDLYSYFVFARGLSPLEVSGAAAYAHIYVFSPRAQVAELRLGTRDGFRVWVNGILVEDGKEVRPEMNGEEKFTRQARKDDDVVPIMLNDGWNSVLLKVCNVHKIWGFYARICDAEGHAIHDIEYAINPPWGDLEVSTWDMPMGYREWPYIWLQMSQSGVNNPTASPFRFLAEGGNPPYTWAVCDGTLPDGLSLDTQTGEIHGTCERQGSYQFTIQVTDSIGSVASRDLTLETKDRPNSWIEKSQLGGCISYASIPWNLYSTLAKIGYKWAGYTTKHHDGFVRWNTAIETPQGGYNSSKSDSLINQFKTLAERYNMKAGFYYSISEQVSEAPGYFDYFNNFPRYIEYIYGHLEELTRNFQPAFYWFDGAQFAPHEYTYWEFDALYSLVKTINPECLIMTNPGAATGRPGQEHDLGDIDVITVEGWGSGGDWYYVNWPQQHRNVNPKAMPIESWRYPSERDNCADWREWARVIFSMISEGFIINLDGIPVPQMQSQLAQWMSGRQESIIGTCPGPIRGERWGYSVINETGDIIYLHFLRNRRGRTGWPEGEETLTVRPLEARVVSVEVLRGDNDNISRETELTFAQDGDELTIDISNVIPDEVVTTLRVTLDTPIGPLN